ncbi:MAG: ATPase, T2SS/T4P/T4SS family, partial [Planctomycetota bacterium]
MKIWFNNVIDTQRRVIEVSGDRVRIGRGSHNEIVLDSPYIAEEAAVLYRRAGVWELVVLGINGAKLGDKQLYNGDRCEIRTNQSIVLFPFSLTLDLPKEHELTHETRRAKLDELMSEVIGEVHLQLLQRMNLDADAKVRDNDEYLVELERNIFNIADGNELLKKHGAELLDHMAGHGVRNQMLAGSKQEAGKSEENNDSVLQAERHWSRLLTAVPDREQELHSTTSYIAKVLKLDADPSNVSHIETIDREFWNAWNAVSDQFHHEFRKYLAVRYLKKEIKDIVFGYGPLEDLLRMRSVSEIMVVDRDHIFVERNGVLENSGKRFISDEVIETIIQRIVAKVSRRIDKSQPLVDARLNDGSRVNAVIPPLAVSGPTITIRKFPYRKMLIDDLVSRGALTRTVAEFLRAVILSRKNIVISGGTGTGKTTLLNCLSDFIPDGERIVTIEDTAELQLAKEHLVRMETKDANVEGAGAYAIRDLL